MQWITPTTLTELTLLLLAFALSAAIGMERGRRLKSAGLRTHTLVGLGSAVFTLVSAYGFTAVVGQEVIVDPTRIAAQIVSGVGFLGAGVIFVRQGAVSGLTTAASIWVTASIGMACGAGIPVLAFMATVLYLLTVTVLGRVGRRLGGSQLDIAVQLRYRDGYGALRQALAMAAEFGVEVVVEDARTVGNPSKGTYETRMRVSAMPGRPVDALLVGWGNISGVRSVKTLDGNE